MNVNRIVQNVLKNLKNILNTYKFTIKVIINRYQEREQLNLLASIVEVQNNRRDSTT